MKIKGLGKYLAIFSITAILVGTFWYLTINFQSNSLQQQTAEKNASTRKERNDNGGQPLSSEHVTDSLATNTDNSSVQLSEDQKIAALIQNKLTPQMRQEINEKLKPGNQPPQEVHTNNGSYLDLSDRSSTVMIAIIDDDDNTVVTDITHPIPE